MHHRSSKLRYRPRSRGALVEAFRGARAARGRRAELAVADFLRADGFAVLGCNVRVGRSELDLVGRRGDLVVVVEVRTRSAGSLEGPFESIGRSKRARLLGAVERLWRERLAALPGVEKVRIDAAAVTFVQGQTQVEYVGGAVWG
jgi:putative endonuclease